MLEKLRNALGQHLGLAAAGTTHNDRRQELLHHLAGCDLASAQGEQEVLALSRDCDGHIREAATRRLAQTNSPDALRAAVLRLNDWVFQVRQAALFACETYLDKEHLPALLASLGAILRLAGRSRADHSGFIDLVGAFIDLPENRRAVLAFFPKSRGPAASFLLERLLGWKGEALTEAIRLSTRHKDFLVRSRFLGACLVPGAEATEALRVLLDDRHPRNRQKAFLALWQENLPPAARASLLPKALLDPAGAVREVALWAAKQSSFDLVGFVADQGVGESLDPRAYLGWLHLLGVVANGDNLPLVQKAFADSRPKVRQAALLAWVALSRETADEPTAQAMADASPKVSKLAGQLLRKGKVLLSGTQLQWIEGQLEKRGELGRLLGFSLRLPYWERLVYLLELLPRYSSAKDQAQIVGEVVAWLLRQQYSLRCQPVEQQERVRRAMRESSLKDVWQNHHGLVVSLEQLD